MDTATLLCRTPSGDAELAVPSRGLSITQRRILTLLDTPASVGEIAKRHQFDRDWLDRDVARLAHSGLVGAQRPPEGAAPTIDALATIRLGGPALARRILVVIVAAALAGVGWHYAAPSAPESSRAHAGAVAPPTDVAAASAASSPAPEPAAIATRVLRGDIPDRTRDAARANAATAAVHAPKAGNEPAEPESRKGAGVAASRFPSTGDAASSGSSVAAPATTAMSSASAAPSTTVTPPPGPAPEVAAPVLVNMPGDAAKSSASPTQLANAAPAEVPNREAAPTKLVPLTREAPEFPREAVAQGVESGTVTARLTIDAQGNVSSVDILDASPHRVFDRAVRSALLRWQFQPGSAGRSTTVDVAFKRD